MNRCGEKVLDELIRIVIFIANLDIFRQCSAIFPPSNFVKTRVGVKIVSLELSNVDGLRTINVIVALTLAHAHHTRTFRIAKHTSM